MKITLLDGRQFEGVFVQGLLPQEVPRVDFCKQLDEEGGYVTFRPDSGKGIVISFPTSDIQCVTDQGEKYAVWRSSFSSEPSWWLFHKERDVIPKT